MNDIDAIIASYMYLYSYRCLVLVLIKRSLVISFVHHGRMLMMFSVSVKHKKDKKIFVHIDIDSAYLFLPRQ